MPAYVNTSALVKRYVTEVGSTWVRRLLADPAQYVIYTSVPAREGHLEVAHAQRLARRVTVHFAQRYQVMTITQAIVDQACGRSRSIQCVPSMQSIWRAR